MISEDEKQSYFCLRQLMHAWLALGTWKLTSPSSRGRRLKAMIVLGRSLGDDTEAVVDTSENESRSLHC